MGFFEDIQKYDSKIALETIEEKISYKNLAEIADYIASYLPKRTVVLILCKNTIATIAGYVGFLRNEIVPIMVNANVDKELVQKIYQSYRPYAVFAPIESWDDGEILLKYKEFALYKSGFDQMHELEMNLALLLTTSGSTGSPKLVRQTYKNILANTTSIIDYLEIDETDKAITTLPINYTYGLSILNTHLIVGAPIFVTEKTFFERDIWEIFNEYQISSFGAVPYTFEMLKRLRFLKMELPYLKYVTQAGGKLNLDLQVEFAECLREQGKKFIVMYGATEATARMAYLPNEYAVEKAGSMGKAIPGGRFEIIDTEGNVIENPEEIGELVYYGENVTPGYAETVEDLKLTDERNGRLLTGDIAKFDEDGFYYIVGRKSRFLKMFGNRVNLMEVEKMLQERGWESACAGQDNHMEIYTTGIDSEEIKKYISQKLKLHTSSFEVIHIESIPHNESGKVLYSKLKKR